MSRAYFKQSLFSKISGTLSALLCFTSFFCVSFQPSAYAYDTSTEENGLPAAKSTRSKFRLKSPMPKLPEGGMAKSSPWVPYLPFNRSQVFFVLNPPEYYGFFSYFTMALGALEFYERGCYAGLRIDFGAHGLYYEPARGPNWWTYYFAPVELGEAKRIKTVRSRLHDCNNCAFYTLMHLNRQRAYELIQKYVKVKPEILNEVNAFEANKFGDKFIIGVHYRGTDKVSTGESKFTPYENVVKEITTFLTNNLIDDYKIFIATDEEGFLKYMEEWFPNKLVYQQMVRSTSTKPLHLDNPNPYLSGKEALLDALLLSRCDYLFRTYSNLSICSCFFNPALPEQVIGN